MLDDGRFLAAGRTPAGQAAVARFTAEGELDTTWAADQPVPGLLVVSAQVGVAPAALVVLADGRVLLGGTTLAVDFTPSLFVARLTADGHLDAAFATGGKLVTTSGPETELGGLAVTADGHILLAATVVRQRHRPRAAGAPDRRRRSRRGLRHQWRGRVPPRRRRHDVLRHRARRRRAHLPRGRQGRRVPGTRWSSRG